MRRGSAGGRVMAIRQRQEALDKYYANPNYCKYCGKVIEVQDGQRVPEVRSKQFCNKSCAASHNNKGNPHNCPIKSGPCKRCGTEVFYKKNERSKSYHKRNYCDECLKMIRAERASLAHFSTIKKGKNGSGIGVLQGTTRDRKIACVEMSTKGELIKDRANWFSFRSAVSRHARKVFASTGKPKICEHCGFIHGVSVCHIKDVKDFPGDATVKEINTPDNLIALCPNCHWLFDHGLLDLLEIRSPTNGSLDKFKDKSIVNRLLSLIDSQPSSSSSARPERRVSTAEANS
jgi:hypothetical protein